MGRIKPYLLRFLVVVLVAGAVLALIYVPRWQVRACPKEGLTPKICFDIENEARKTLAYIMGGILAITAIFLTFWRNWIAQEGQITERFTRAIEQLGSEEMAIRLGGIYALERIAYDSKKDYWPIMETLTAYVRENAPWPPKDLAATTAKEPSAPKLATDIQAVLTVLGRRKYRFKYGEDERLDLTNTNLHGADLREVHLEGAHISGAHLEGADLRRTHLEDAGLRKVHLEQADLREAYLEGAHLREAHLEEAHLSGAHLKQARLMGAHLEGADLVDARLEGAVLLGAHLEGADLRGAHLEGADLGGATGSTREQLAKAITDEKTVPPDYLQEERPEGKGPEGEQEG
jgi:uncharacterized protein YjbI with pentapeptide repeats